MQKTLNIFWFLVAIVEHVLAHLDTWQMKSLSVHSNALVFAFLKNQTNPKEVENEKCYEIHVKIVLLYGTNAFFF